MNMIGSNSEVLVSKRLMIRRLAIAVAVVAMIALGSLFLYAHFLNERAENMVRTAYELSDQKQIPTLAEIQERFGERLKRFDECPPSECSYTVVLSNRVLAALHLVPYTEMESYFWVRNGMVLGNMVNYTTKVNHRYSVVSHVQIDFCKGCQTFAIYPWDQSSPLDTNGLVEIGNEASAQNRRVVLSLNTRCLTTFGGCNSVADLLPTVWQQTANKRIACKIPNDRGSVE
jgi:hypothetical protein